MVGHGNCRKVSLSLCSNLKQEFKEQKQAKLKRVCVGMSESCGYPVMTFQIMQRINTELFDDRTAALFKWEFSVRVVTNKGDQLLDTSWLEGNVYLVNLS